MAIGPPTVGGGIPRDDSYLVRRVEALEAIVQQYMAGGSINASEIDPNGTLRVNGGLDVSGTGGITVEGGGGVNILGGGSFSLIDPATGHTVVYLGIASIPDGSGRTQMVAYFTRDDGTAALQLADDGTAPGHAHQQALQWFDRSGNITFSDDTVSGVGVGSPYTPEGVFNDITGPTNTTTSASFVAMQWADCYQQHPKVTAGVLVQTPSGTAGQIRLTIGGSQIGSVVAVPSASFGEMVIAPGAWPGGSFAFQQRVVVQLEARVVSGAGAIGVRGLGLWGVGS